METINLDRFTPLETYGHSSKGNQLKWKHEAFWYKADHMGYEGLAEVIISRLLCHSNVTDYVLYEPAAIEYKKRRYNGCRSRNMLGEEEELITVDRLFRQYTGGSLTSVLAQMPSLRDRILFITKTQNTATS